METPIPTSDQKCFPFADAVPASTGEAQTQSPPLGTDATVASASSPAVGVEPAPTPAEQPAGPSGTQGKGGAKTAKAKLPKKAGGLVKKVVTPASADQADVASLAVTEVLNIVTKENDVTSASVPAKSEPAVAALTNVPDGEPFSSLTLSTTVEVFSFLDLEIKRFEQVLNRFPAGRDREKEETLWLFSLCSAFKGAARLISARKGFILMFVKANSPRGEYLKRAAELFPGTDERTCRYYVAQSRLLLKTVGVNFDENGGVEYFKNLKDSWTLASILSVAKSFYKTAGPAPAKVVGNSVAKKAAPAKKAQSGYVKEETFQKNCDHLSDTAEKLLAQIKRHSQADLDKGRNCIRNSTPEPFRSFYLAALDARQAALVIEVDSSINI